MAQAKGGTKALLVTSAGARVKRSWKSLILRLARRRVMMTFNLFAGICLALVVLIFSPKLENPFLKPPPEHPCGQNAGHEKLPDGSTQCYTKRNHKTKRIEIK